MLLNHQWITEVKEEIKRYLETNENINMIMQNLWDAAKAVLWGKFTVVKSYLRKQEKSQITYPYTQSNYRKNKKIQIPKATRERTNRPKVREKEIIKIREEIHLILAQRPRNDKEQK